MRGRRKRQPDAVVVKEYMDKMDEMNDAFTVATLIEMVGQNITDSLEEQLTEWANRCEGLNERGRKVIADIAAAKQKETRQLTRDQSGSESSTINHGGDSLSISTGNEMSSASPSAPVTASLSRSSSLSSPANTITTSTSEASVSPPAAGGVDHDKGNFQSMSESAVCSSGVEFNIAVVKITTRDEYNQDLSKEEKQLGSCELTEELKGCYKSTEWSHSGEEAFLMKSKISCAVDTEEQACAVARKLLQGSGVVFYKTQVVTVEGNDMIIHMGACVSSTNLVPLSSRLYQSTMHFPV